MGGEPFDPRFVPPPGQGPPDWDGVGVPVQEQPRVPPRPLPMMINMDIVEGVRREDDGSVTQVKLVRCIIETPQGATVLFADGNEAVQIGQDWITNGEKAKSPLTIVGAGAMSAVGEMGDSPGGSPVGG